MPEIVQILLAFLGLAAILLGPAVLKRLGRTRAWAKSWLQLLSWLFLIAGVALAMNPGLVLPATPPEFRPGALPWDMQIFGAMVTGTLLAIWGGVWLFVASRRRPPSP